MSNLRTLAVTSLLVTLPLMSVQADGSSIVESKKLELDLQVNPEDMDSDNYDSQVRFNAMGEMVIKAPLDLSLNVRGRIEKSLEAYGDEDLDEDLFWETLERLSVSGKLFVDIEVGKLNAGFGAQDGPGKSQRNYHRDSAASQVSQELESVTGIKLSSIPEMHEEDFGIAAKIINNALAGVSITIYDGDSEEKMDLDSFTEMNSVAVRKDGEFMGANYQVSFVFGEKDGKDDQRLSASAEKCFDDTCLYGEYQYLDESEVSPYESTTTVGAYTVLRNEYVDTVAAEYENVAAKDGETAPGDKVGLIAKKQMGRWEFGASLHRDLDNDDNIFGLNGSIKW